MAASEPDSASRRAGACPPPSSFPERSSAGDALLSEGNEAAQARSPFPRREGGQGVRSLVIGLGNPILGDDGVGWRVAEDLGQIVAAEALTIEVDSLAVGGLSLMERMVGYDRVVVVDAIRMGTAPIGAVTLFPFRDLPDPGAGHLSSGHDATLATALAAGRALGAELPDESQIWIVAVEAETVYDFSQELTPPVEAAIPRAVQLALEALS